MKRIYYKIRRIVFRTPRFFKITAIILLIVLAVLFVDAAIIYAKQGKMGLIRTPIGKMILGPYRSIRNLSDFFYIGYEFQKNDLPIYNLKIDPEDWDFLNKNLPSSYEGERLTDQYRQSVKVDFFYEGKKYEGKASYRGWVSNHWSNQKKSWEIKLKKTDLLNGQRTFKFIIPEDRGVAMEYLNQYRTRKMGLYPLFSFFGILKVNGQNQGLYFIVESWDGNYLAKNELLDETDMFAFDYRWGWGEESGKADSFSGLENFSKEKDNPFDEKSDFAPLDRLLYLINDASGEEFKKDIGKVVDLDNLFTLEAYQMMVSSSHWDSLNVRFFTDRETGKLIFVPWDINIDYPDPYIEKAITSLNTRIFSIPEFAYRRNSILWNYVKNDDNLADDLNFYDQTFNKIKAAIAQDHMKVNSTRWFFKEYKKIRQMVIDNFNYAKDVLSQARAAIVIYRENNHPSYFDVKTEGLTEVAIKEVVLSNATSTASFTDNDHRLFFDSNNNQKFDPADQLVGAFKYNRRENSYWLSPVSDFVMSTKKAPIDDSPDFGFSYQPKVYRFFIKSSTANNSLRDAEIKIKNAVTGDLAQQIVRYVNNDNYKYLDLVDLSLDDFVKKYPIFKKIDSQSVVLSGTRHIVAQDIIIPAGVKLIINPGAKIFLNPGVSIISYGSIKAEGTEKTPIIFDSAVSGRPWGSLGLSESRGPNSFEHVKLRNGKDAHINGVYYSGMLSAYRSDVTINHSEFYGAQADDSLNVKHAVVRINNSKFSNNSGDAIDLDYIKDGVVQNSQFYNNGGDSIDLSGSTIVIRDNYITGSKDKCVSIGEKSLEPVIYNNVLNGCDIGVQSKDSSTAKIINNVIVNNRIGIDAYEKKAIFGGGQADVYNSIIWRNEIAVQAGGKSMISVYNSDIQGGGNENNNFSIEPPFKDSKNNDYSLEWEKADISFSGGLAGILAEYLNIDSDQAPVGLNQ